MQHVFYTCTAFPGEAALPRRKHFPQSLSRDAQEEPAFYPEKVTIELHGSLLRYLHTHPDKMQVLLERLARAIGKSVSSVEVQPRQGTQ